MPKVLAINVTSNWGSTGKIAEQIGVLAQNQGWESYMAYGRHRNPSSLLSFRVGNDIEVKIHYFLSHFLDCEGLGSWFATRKLIKKIDEIKPDIIHLHNIHGHYLNYPVLIKHINKREIPVVWTLHDAWIITGHCYLFGGTGCEKWKTECHHCPMAIKYGLDRSRQNFKRKKQIFTSLKQVELVTVSKWLKNVIGESFMKDYPCRTIYNGIDLNVFQPRESDWKKRLGVENRYMILGVATAWTESKGLSDFYQLANQLPEQYKIVLVGLGEEQIKDLPANLIGIKKTESQLKLVELYSSADVVVSLSKGESFGLTPVEGMACGTPAVVYDNAALPELITPETGAVVKAGDINGVVEAIERICILSDDEMSAMQKSCIERTRSHYDTNKNYSDFIGIYNKLIANKLMGGVK